MTKLTMELQNAIDRLDDWLKLGFDEDEAKDLRIDLQKLLQESK